MATTNKRRLELGRLTTKLEVQQNIGTSDGLGGVTEDWSRHFDIMADVQTLSGYEALVAMSTSAKISNRVICRYDSRITESKRFVFGTRYLNIKKIDNIDMRNRKLVILCSETK